MIRGFDLIGDGNKDPCMCVCMLRWREERQVREGERERWVGSAQVYLN